MDTLNYGIIGNCRSAALVSETGAIEWCCLPEFNSSSIFAKLLDKTIGGSFEVLVSDDYNITQRYINKTNILITIFDNGTDSFEVMDFMPRYPTNSKGYYIPPDIIRYFRPKTGKPKFRVLYDPKLEYARHNVAHKIEEDYIKSYTLAGDYDSIYLYTSFDKTKVLNKEEFELTEDAFFLLSYHQKILKQTIERTYLKLQRTKVYWLNWSERTYNFTKYNDEITRSALVLKLLSYDKTGAVLAAATTSLPETIAEIRNWDYRFCWIRDASMVIKIMTHLGHLRMAHRFLDFIMEVIPDKDEKIQIMYGINREKELTESLLEHMEGYADSAPVRIGNDAYHQKQNDIYGVLMDVIYQQVDIFETSLENIEELWTITRSIVKIVARNWEKPDKGIWEIRTEEKHFTFSKVLCWVAIDRALKIARMIDKREYFEPWKKLREEIKHDIHEKAWNENVQAYTQYYGSDDLDASTLLMESYGFIDASDSRFKSTVMATKKHLSRDGLMYRYKNQDDFGQPTSSFTICTFWLINSLYKIGEKAEATELFERLLSYSNHVGLFSEDIDFETKRLLGNFPQAYSHLALIETAMYMAEDIEIDEQSIFESLF